MEKQKSTLTDWSLECGLYSWRLRGKVKGDTRWPDGTEVTTSKLLQIDFVKQEAETQNTVYSLR